MRDRAARLRSPQTQTHGQQTRARPRASCRQDHGAFPIRTSCRLGSPFQPRSRQGDLAPAPGTAAGELRPISARRDLRQPSTGSLASATDSSGRRSRGAQVQMALQAWQGSNKMMCGWTASAELVGRPCPTAGGRVVPQTGDRRMASAKGHPALSGKLLSLAVLLHHGFEPLAIDLDPAAAYHGQAAGGVEKLGSSVSVRASPSSVTCILKSSRASLPTPTAGLPPTMAVTWGRDGRFAFHPAGMRSTTPALSKAAASPSSRNASSGVQRRG